MKPIDLSTKQSNIYTDLIVVSIYIIQSGFERENLYFPSLFSLIWFSTMVCLLAAPF